MGARGPLPKKRMMRDSTSNRRVRGLPADAAAIYRRLVRDIAGLDVSDAALVEDLARWVAIAKRAYADLHDGAGEMSLTVTDTAHGNQEEGRKNPLLIVLRTASEQIRANAQQLGASPMARARLPAPPTETGSFGEQFFQMAAERLNAKQKRE